MNMRPSSPSGQGRNLSSGNYNDYYLTPSKNRKSTKKNPWLFLSVIVITLIVLPFISHYKLLNDIEDTSHIGLNQNIPIDDSIAENEIDHSSNEMENIENINNNENLENSELDNSDSHFDIKAEALKDNDNDENDHIIDNDDVEENQSKSDSIVTSNEEMTNEEITNDEVLAEEAEKEQNLNPNNNEVNDGEDDEEENNEQVSNSVGDDNDDNSQASNIEVVSLVSNGIAGGELIGGTFDGKSVKLLQQIKLPSRPVFQFVNVRNYWPLISILKNHGWSNGPLALAQRVNMFFTRGSVPPRLIKGTQFVNSIGLSGCIGGSKTLQLSCRRRRASHDGCQYEDLKIQPTQFNMLNVDECKKFFRVASLPENDEKIWLAKPSYTFHGAGITIHKGITQLKTLYGSCSKPNHLIIMEYVDQPATIMGGYKFDFRTYLLVASLKPQLVFYHDGFIRKSEKRYDRNSKVSLYF